MDLGELDSMRAWLLASAGAWPDRSGRTPKPTDGSFSLLEHAYNAKLLRSDFDRLTNG